MPHRPSLLIKFPNVTILVDCAINFDVLNNFLPARWVKSCSQAGHGLAPKEVSVKGLARIGGELLIDAIPEVQPVTVRKRQPR